MAKYHVTPTGVLPCNDNTGRCPYLKGEENNHFHDPVKAEAVFADRMVKENGQFSTVKRAAAVQTANDLRARMGAPVATSSAHHRAATLFRGAKTGSRTGFATRVATSGAAPSKAANVMAMSLNRR